MCVGIRTCDGRILVASENETKGGRQKYYNSKLRYQNEAFTLGHSSLHIITLENRLKKGLKKLRFRSSVATNTTDFVGINWPTLAKIWSAGIFTSLYWNSPLSVTHGKGYQERHPSNETSRMTWTYTFSGSTDLAFHSVGIYRRKSKRRER